MPDRGKWEVRGDLYCSWWERGGWACYYMTGHITGTADRATFIGETSKTVYPGYSVAGRKDRRTD